MEDVTIIWVLRKKFSEKNGKKQESVRLQMLQNIIEYLNI